MKWSNRSMFDSHLLSFLLFSLRAWPGPQYRFSPPATADASCITATLVVRMFLLLFSFGWCSHKCNQDPPGHKMG